MDLGNFAVSTLNHYLKGTNFPAQKEEVARNAEGNGAPQDLLTQIRNADTERFENPEEVMQALQSTPDTPDEAPEVERIRAKEELSPPLGFWR